MGQSNGKIGDLLRHDEKRSVATDLASNNEDRIHGMTSCYCKRYVYIYITLINHNITMWIKNSMGRNNSSAGLPAGLIGRCCSCFLFLACTCSFVLLLRVFAYYYYYYYSYYHAYSYSYSYAYSSTPSSLLPKVLNW